MPFRTIISLLLLAWCCGQAGRAQGEGLRPFRVVCYNVENYFDCVDDSLTDDSEFLPGGIRGWNHARYRLKQAHVARVLAAIDARMGEVYWAEYQRDENGIWHGEETEAVLKPEIVHERMQQLSGEWVTVGTGWQAWPDLGKESGLVLRDGEVLLPAAEDMLPIACQMFAEGKTVAVEHAEPVYLRNNVAWKKLPGKE